MSDPTAQLNAALEGRYRVEGRLGEGGMATVFLAEDLRHRRRVAIKVLKPELAAAVGSERFLAEIETTAGLQHPHILALFDSGEADGLLWYAMPYVEGESLRNLLEREGQLPIDVAVSMVRKVASALQAAHDRGIVHRDVKPANILLQDGEPLLADFGIALAVASAGDARLTETGLSVGTPIYMSPEQATGDEDPGPRSDQYALATVLYEMLTGSPPFQADSRQAVISRLLTRDPTPVREHRRRVHPEIEEALDRALARLPADRFQRVADFSEALRRGMEAPRGPGVGAEPGARRRAWVPWTVAAAGMTMAFAAWIAAPSSETDGPSPSHLSVAVPGLMVSLAPQDRQLGISSDGTTLFYSAADAEGVARTFRRRLADPAPEVLEAVPEGLVGYVVSPGRAEVAGYARSPNQGHRFGSSGGNVAALPPQLWTPFTGGWDREGTLWATRGERDGIYRVDASGEVTRPFEGRFAGFLLHQVLPDGRTAILGSTPPGTWIGPAHLLDLSTGVLSEPVLQDVAAARYTSGFLVYVRADGRLMAAEFDPGTEAFLGRPVQLASAVISDSGNPQFVVSDEGTVAYIPQEPISLVLASRNGDLRPATLETGAYHAPAFSPDGRRIVTDRRDGNGTNLWVIDLAEGIPVRASFERPSWDGRWTPDGDLIHRSSSDATPFSVLFRTTPGSVVSDSLNAVPGLAFSGHVLSDGETLITVANDGDGETGWDVLRIDDGGGGAVEPLVATPFNEIQPSVSPDERWLAFASDRSGRNEVYAQRLTGEGEALQVSLGGGTEPVWSPSGGEIFYRTGSGAEAVMMTARVETDAELRVVSRGELFSMGDMATSSVHQNYDVSPDGETFVMVRDRAPTRIMVIQNLPALVALLGRD